MPSILEEQTKFYLNCDCNAKNIKKLLLILQHESVGFN